MEMKLRTFFPLAGLLAFLMIVNGGNGGLVGGYESPSPPALYSASRQLDTAVNELDGPTTTETNSEDEEGSSEESPTVSSAGGYEDSSSLEMKEEVMTRPMDQLSVENAQSYNYKSPRPQGDSMSLYQAPRDQGWSQPTEKSEMPNGGYDSPSTSTGINYSNNQFYLPPSGSQNSLHREPEMRKDNNEPMMMERKQGLPQENLKQNFYPNPSNGMSHKGEMTSTPISVLPAEIQSEYHEQSAKTMRNGNHQQNYQQSQIQNHQQNHQEVGYSHQGPNIIQPQMHDKFQRDHNQGEITQMNNQMSYFRPQQHQFPARFQEQLQQVDSPHQTQVPFERNRQHEERVMSWQQGFSPRSLFHQSDVSFPQDQEDESEFEGLNSNIVDAELLARVQKIIEDHEREERRLLEEQRRNSAQPPHNDNKNNYNQGFEQSRINGYPGNENPSYNHENNGVEGRDGRAFEGQFERREQTFPQEGYSNGEQNSLNFNEAQNHFEQKNENVEFERAGNPNSVIYQQAILSSHFVDSSPKQGNNDNYQQPQQNMGQFYSNQQQNTQQNYHENFQQNVPQNYEQNVYQNVPQNIHQSVHQNVEHNIQDNIPQVAPQYVQYGISSQPEPNNFFYPQRTQVRFTPLDAKMMELTGSPNLYQTPQHQNVQVSYKYGVEENSQFPIEGRQGEARQQEYNFRPSPRDDRMDQNQINNYENQMNGYLPPPSQISPIGPIEDNSYPKYETKTIVIHEQPYNYDESHPEPKDTSVTISLGRDEQPRIEYPSYEQQVFRETHNQPNNNENVAYGRPIVESTHETTGNSRGYETPMIIPNTGNFNGGTHGDERRFYMVPSTSFSSSEREQNSGRYLPPTTEELKDVKQADENNRLDLNPNNENNRPMEGYGTGGENNRRLDAGVSGRNEKEETPSNIVALPVHEYMPPPHQQLSKRFSHNNFYSYRVK